MNLDSKSWYVRYFWFVQRKLFDKLPEHYPNGTNLCHFMRVTCLWGPIVATILGGSIGFLVWMLVIAPIISLGFFWYLGVWTFGVGVFLLTKALSEILTLSGEKEDGFLRCVVEYTRAKKAKICPLVNFSDDDEEAV